MLCSEWVPSEWESKQLIKNINKSIKTFLLKYKSIIHNNASCSEKVHLMLSLTLKSRHILVSSCFVNAAWSELISLLIQTRTLSLQEALLWTNILVKNILMLDLFQLLSSPDVHWWTGVVWIIVMFLSDSHSDGTHSLQSIHLWARDEMLHFSKSAEETTSTSWMAWV